jgi:UDP-N-acetylmuramate--alanine ligase
LLICHFSFVIFNQRPKTKDQRPKTNNQMFRRIQHVHFVGIGGIGMSGIAEVLINLGFRVSGSDLKASSVTDRLKQMGVEIFEGHNAENVGQPHVVVRSTAVRDDNPEVVEAHRRSIPVIPRAEMLAELMRLKPHTVAVAGSHGKTTTTSMVATVLGHAGLDPTMVVGGVVGAFGSNAHLGTSDLMVVEADESDRSFLMLTPTIAVVTNIDREHMDYYHDMDDVRACFASFVNKVPFYGSSVLCLDDPNVQAIIPLLERRRLTYGLSAQADVSAHGIRYDNNFGSTFSVWRGSDVVGELTLRVPGMHNVYNALAAIAVGFELEVSFDKIAEGLFSFTGAGRRFQAKGEVNDVLVVDDYGHHPTEIRATLAAAKLGSGGRRIVVLFQPHRYSRTHDLMQEFARSFNNADVLFITDIYAASEDPIEGVTAEALTAAITRFGHKDANYIGGLENAATILRDKVQPGDLVVTLGAGTVNRVCDQLLYLLREQSQGTSG